MSQKLTKLYRHEPNIDREFLNIYNRVLTNETNTTNVANTITTYISSFTEVDPIFSAWLATDPYLKLDQTTPQTIINGFPSYEAGHGEITGDHMLIDKEYVDSGTWLMPPIIEWYDPTGGLPIDPAVGDRYGADATANGWTIDYIYEWNGDEWIESEPEEGWMIWALFELMFYVFFSGGWMEVGGSSYLKLDQTTPQLFTGGDVTGTGLLKVTAGLLGLDESTYLTVETDPIYTASSWYTTTNNAANWDTAYGWGNHAGLYTPIAHKTTEDALNGLVKVDGAGNYSAITDNSSNWNTAYGWGNPSGVYLPLTGGTLSGNLILTRAVGYSPYIYLVSESGSMTIQRQHDTIKAGYITVSGSDPLIIQAGSIRLGTANLTLTGSIASTGSRVTKGWFTDLEVTNVPTVNGTALAITNWNTAVTNLNYANLTAGYIPYRGTNLVNSPIYTDGTNVGIGVVPTAHFHSLGIIKSGGVGVNGSIELARTSDGNTVFSLAVTSAYEFTLWQAAGLTSKMVMGLSGIEFRTEEGGSPYAATTKMVVSQGTDAHVGIGKTTGLNETLEVAGYINADTGYKVNGTTFITSSGMTVSNPKIFGGGLDSTLGDVVTFANSNYPTQYLNKIRSAHSSAPAESLLTFELATGAATTLEVLRLSGDGYANVNLGYKCGGTAPVADATYTVGDRITPVTGNLGTITTKGGIITAIQQAT